MTWLTDLMLDIQRYKVVSLRSKEHIGDLMGSVLKGDKVLLWCDGLG